MRLITYAKTKSELLNAQHAGASEVILTHEELSRLGGLQADALSILALEARNLDLRPVLEWDILMTPERFERAVTEIKNLDLNRFSAVRVQDPGALEFVLQNFDKLPIQLILETGNHNLESIQRWCSYVGDRLERVILSVQIPKARLAHYIETLKVPVEVMGLGPILLLYTPRHLLSNQGLERAADSPMIQAMASSEETQHSGFRVLENSHGTFLFHPKDYCLVEQAQELRTLKLGAFRADLRLHDRPEDIVALGKVLREGSEEKFRALAQDFVSQYGKSVTRCFYQANATDVLFKKLKNTKIQRTDDGYIGEVAEISRGRHMIIHVLGKGQSLQAGQKLKFINPEGHVVEASVEQVMNLDREPVESIAQGDFALLPYLKLVTPRSAVYLVPLS